MMIYFYSNGSSEESKNILNYFKKAKIEVLSNLNKGKSAESLAEIEALVIFGDLDDQASYFMALALSQNKVVLFLPAKAKYNVGQLKNWLNSPNFKDKITVKVWQDKTGFGDLANFLQTLDKDSGRDMIHLKYTLRISPKISDYLIWKSQDAHKRKADMIREIILQMMSDDKKYQEFLQEKFKLKD